MMIRMAIAWIWAIEDLSDYEVRDEGARPLAVKENEWNWGRHGSLKSFDLRVVTQNVPSQLYRVWISAKT